MASPSREGTLRQAIARQKAVIKQIDKTRDEATTELEKLRGELGSIECRAPVNPPERIGDDGGAPTTASQKVALVGTAAVSPPSLHPGNGLHRAPGRCRGAHPGVVPNAR